ncbi:MAG: tRNA pseudouridine(38-40) synthase TruA [Alphaproteobacteria bacterium]|nr:tRNA pseudouridine(38-40) synthase TruA [Alphaproteobacteria bacterium]
MTRYRLTLEYDGRDLVGWQRQDNGPSVQAALVEAVAAFSGESVEVVGAGRTDAGVHALGQVAHFDLAREFPPERVMGAINHFLKPRPIVVLEAAVAPADFHARFSAIERRYRYRILNRRAPPALEAGRVCHVTTPLDHAAMHAAAQGLVGRHDFSSFRAAECQAKSPLKTLDELSVWRRGDEVEIFARARSFLHHQVRNMVGTLRLVGEGKWSADDVARALAARDRGAAGPTASPEGLYLVAVLYPSA